MRSDRCFALTTDHDDAVDVIGHYDEFTVKQCYIRTKSSSAKPFLAGDVAEVVYAHFAVDDFSEEGLALVGDHGDEVAAFGGVVVAFEADGSAMVRMG